MRLHSPSESVQTNTSSEEADQAEEEYRTSRDRLAQQMLKAGE